MVFRSNILPRLQEGRCLEASLQVADHPVRRPQRRPQMPPRDDLNGAGDVPVRLDGLEDQRSEGEPLVLPEAVNPPIGGAFGADAADHLIEGRC